VWLSDPVGGYTVHGAYDILTNGVTPTMDTPLELVWHHQVSQKVLVFAWQLIQDRLPMKVNLPSCRVIPTSMAYCVSGCGHVETAEHLFLTCTTFATLWQHVREWIGFVGSILIIFSIICCNLL